MASGSNRRLIWNAREQVLSTDLNRAEAFAASDFDELLRQWLLNRTFPGFNLPTDDPFFGQDNYFGITEDHSTTETPTYGVVFGGFDLISTPGTLQVTIGPGVAAMVNPDASPNGDDASAKFVRDPGSTTLTLPGGDPTSITISVVEVARTDSVTETDSRNQYNTSTGLFTPVSLSKVGSGIFTYRVRSATPGAGIPTGQNGWMPLYVVSVPVLGTDITTATIWDVRPLLSGRVKDSLLPMHGPGHFQGCWGSAAVFTSPVVLDGYAIVHDQFGYRLGGALVDGYGASANLSNSAHWAGGFAPSANSFYYVYLAVPVTLSGATLVPNRPALGPRWAKFTRPDAGGPQHPVEPVGFLLVSATPPDEAGKASLSSPTSMQLGATMAGHCIAAGWMGSGGTMTGFMMDGHACMLDVNDVVGAHPFITNAAAGGAVSWILVPNTHYPKNAKGIYVELGIPFSDAVANADIITGITVAPQGHATSMTIHQVTMRAADTNAHVDWVRCHIPLESRPSTGAAANITVTAAQVTGGTITGNGTIRILGFDF